MSKSSAHLQIHCWSNYKASLLNYILHCSLFFCANFWEYRASPVNYTTESIYMKLECELKKPTYMYVYYTYIHQVIHHQPTCFYIQWRSPVYITYIFTQVIELPYIYIYIYIYIPLYHIYYIYIIYYTVISYIICCNLCNFKKDVSNGEQKNPKWSTVS